MAESRKELASIKPDVLALLKRKNKIRYVCQDLTLSEMKGVRDRFDELYEERLQEEKKSAEIRNEQSRLIASKVDELLGQGIELDFIEQMISEKRVNTAPDEGVTAIYFKDGVGWAGRGRRPKPFQGLSNSQLEQHRIKHK